MALVGHFKIMILTTTLLAGAGLIFYTYQLYRRYRHPFLHPMWLAILFLNLAFLTGFFSDYIFVNLFEDVASFKSSPIMEVTDPLGSLFFLGLAFSLFALDRALSGKQVSRIMTWIFALTVAIVAVDSMGGLLERNGPATLEAISRVKTGLLMVSFLFCLGILIHIIAASGRMEKNSGTGDWRMLGTFYTGGCAAILISSIFAGELHGVTFATVSLLFNLFPFYWLRRNLVGPGNALEKAVADVDLSEVFEQYAISSRQREIAELVLRGKSNREIADDLFIAPHTVKNHIYNIYKKMGVKSRFELINLFLENRRG